MFVDSHCHLDRVDLTPYDGDFSAMINNTRSQGVDHMLCVSIDLESYPSMAGLVKGYDDISISVGVHPNDRDRHEPDADELVELAKDAANVAIGETGLDYFRCEGDLTWQQDRFRTHIQAANTARKPLIVHTREAREDTIQILTEENARDAGGVLHCFTETWEMARAALDIGFYISFSGILTFKNAESLREVAKKVPLDRILIETDSPYLAPIPHRGKSNQPGYVPLVAETLAGLLDKSVESIAETTTENFYRLFSAAKPGS